MTLPLDINTFSFPTDSHDLVGYLSAGTCGLGELANRGTSPTCHCIQKLTVYLFPYTKIRRQRQYRYNVGKRNAQMRQQSDSCIIPRNWQNDDARDNPDTSKQDRVKIETASKLGFSTDGWGLHGHH